jgi:hypothetical protein
MLSDTTVDIPFFKGFGDRMTLKRGLATTIVTAGLLLASVAVAQPVSALTHPGVTVWANGVNVRFDATNGTTTRPCDLYPSLANCPVVKAVINAGTYEADCQAQGQTISYGGYTSNWWTAVHRGAPGQGTPWVGYVSNVFLTGPAKMPNVPVCQH